MNNYTKHEVFAALQAEVIYIIMRVVDGGGSSAENRDYNMAMLFSYAAASYWKAGKICHFLVTKHSGRLLHRSHGKRKWMLFHISRIHHEASLPLENFWNATELQALYPTRRNSTLGTLERTTSEIS
ncbi:hypothetical protein ColLi_02785 [Colletotrichum liriopes]|uniref:Uncharacterized protein n=1 Tax=Colletotrichum liriopes TaxID=708192 RepID=A0AA37LQ23_9PEZI|nr:hypothetical protein ColLi_02785 [Colletotrichum liriopes]